MQGLCKNIHTIAFLTAAEGHGENAEIGNTWTRACTYQHPKDGIHLIKHLCGD